MEIVYAIAIATLGAVAYAQYQRIKLLRAALIELHESVESMQKHVATMDNLNDKRHASSERSVDQLLELARLHEEMIKRHLDRLAQYIPEAR